MDRLNNICFNTGVENEYKQIRFSGNLAEGDIIELLDYYYPSLKRGNIKRLIENVINAKISFGELVYLAEKIYPHLQTIRYMLNSEPTQVDILDLAMEIFMNTEKDENINDNERSIIIERLRNITTTSEIDNEIPKYFTKDEIGYYTISPLYSIINYVDFDKPDNYKVIDDRFYSEEQMVLYERNSSLFNRIS